MKEAHIWMIVCILSLQIFCFHLSIAEHATVNFLPGFHGPLPFEFETGYIDVSDDKEEVQLFYYFVKSIKNAKEDPLILWLTGGPGCSSISAFLYEIGPLNFEKRKYNGSIPTLILNPNSWTKVANIIFVDSPVGTGFSYTTNPDVVSSSDTLQVYQLYKFLSKWLMEHPEFLSNSIYIGGDSYSGIIVPALVQTISDAKQDGVMHPINLKGYLEGNPTTDSTIEHNAQVPFAHGMGLIPDELYQSLKRSCRGQYVEPTNSKCLKYLATFKELISEINKAHILEPSCPLVSPKPTEIFGKRRSTIEKYQYLDLDPSVLPSFQCRSYGYLLSYYWMSERSVQKALHVKNETGVNWARCNFGLPYANDIPNTIEYHKYLSTKGYRSLIYSGDHDMIIPFLGTQTWIRSLNYSIVDDWRQWRVEDQVAGYTRTYSNKMTFATIKGGGHTAPEYMPVNCYAMFERWISEKPL